VKRGFRQYTLMQIELMQKIRDLGKVVRSSKGTQLLEDGLALLEEEAMQLELDWYTVPTPGDRPGKEDQHARNLLLAEGRSIEVRRTQILQDLEHLERRVAAKRDAIRFNQTSLMAGAAVVLAAIAIAVAIVSQLVQSGVMPRLPSLP